VGSLKGLLAIDWARQASRVLPERYAQFQTNLDAARETGGDPTVP
jgi:hypothetical protein